MDVTTTMGCPSEEELIDFVEGRMRAVPPSFEAHLACCETCREIVVVAASVETRDSGAERYEILEELGRGGQSRVLKVCDRELRREVALKLFVNDGREGSHAPTPADRCLREVRTAAVLSHPAILPIHDMGVHRSGAPFYTMPIIDGRTLAEVVARAESLDERLRLLPHVVQICQAIGYAHEQRIVHRDIKPDNVMVGSFGETVLLDWGLALLPDRPDASGVLSAPSEDGVTLDGSVMGTPGYMSPEQAEGQTVGAASDIWSLGAVLYFVLSGRVPFRGPSVASTLALVRRGRTKPITARDGRVPPELAAIVSKAMSRLPSNRYETAKALADDIIAFQSGGKVAAYRYDLRERVARFARRYKALLAVLGAITVALATVAVVSTLAYRTSSMALTEAENARTQAEQQARDHHAQTVDKAYELSLAHVDAAERERERGHVLAARRLAQSALRESPSYRHGPSYEPGAEARHPGARSVIARARGQLALAAIDHVENETRVPAPPPLGGELRATAVGGGLLGIAGTSREALLSRFSDGRLVASLSHPVDVNDLAISPAGTVALTQDEAGTIRRWNVQTQTVEGRWSGGVADGVLLAVADNGAFAFLSSHTELTVVTTDGPWSVAVERATALIISPDGTRVTVGNAAGELVVIDTARQREVARADAHPRPIVRLAQATADSLILAAGANEIAHVEPSTGEIVRRHNVDDQIHAMGLSPDTERLYVATPTEVVVFDMDQKHPLARMPIPQSGVVHQLWRGAEVVYASTGTETYGWRVRPSLSGPIGQDVRASTVYADGVQFTPLARRAAVARVDWTTGATSVIELDATSPAARLAIAADRGITRHYDRSVVTWEIEADTWTAVHTRSFPVATADALAASPASGRFAIGLRDGSLRVGDLRHPEDVTRLDGRTGPIVNLSFDPTGRYLLSASSIPAEVTWWDLTEATPKPVRIASDERNYRAACFGSSSREVYVAGSSGVSRWTMDGTHETIDDTPHRSVVYGDGVVAAQTTDFKLNVWLADTHEPFAIVAAYGHRRAPGFVLVPGRSAVRILAYDDAYELAFDAVADATVQP